jgi:MFS transporter, SHS family, lactate transporter
MRLIGAVSSGWIGDRLGRRLPLMMSISGYSLCNFIAGFSPAFWFLFLFRALLGFFMGAEWPAGAALAMETWPIRSRGLMSGVLQGSWGIGFLLSSAAYGLLFNLIGWRGLLWLGVVPALTVVYVRIFVKEPPVWVENRQIQRTEQREVRLPLLSIFKRGMRGNTALACWWMAGGLVGYYSINGMFATHLQKDLGLSPGLIATPIMFANAFGFLSSIFWGWAGDRIGRRWAMIIPGLLGLPCVFAFLLSANYWVIAVGFALQGVLGGGSGAHAPSLMNERFPTEVRATASAFCYHIGTILAGIVPPIVTFFALNYHLGFSTPMLAGCLIGTGSFCLALFLGPETKGKELVPDLVLA